jgi:hypothetical protein
MLQKAMTQITKNIERSASINAADEFQHPGIKGVIHNQVTNPVSSKEILKKNIKGIFLRKGKMSLHLWLKT